MISFIKYLIVFSIGIISMYFYNQTINNKNHFENKKIQNDCIENKVIIKKEIEEDPNKDFYEFLDSYQVESDIKPVTVTTVYSKNKKLQSKYRCDGREYCSQMTSCEEAKFFINNCPNTKMDGDGDGIPCWRQWCGH